MHRSTIDFNSVTVHSDSDVLYHRFKNQTFQNFSVEGMLTQQPGILPIFSNVATFSRILSIFERQCDGP